jgi:hypothetical protein
MNHNQRDIVEKDWTVTISVNERDGQTQATARLRLGERNRWVLDCPGSAPPSTASRASAANWPPRALYRIWRAA